MNIFITDKRLSPHFKWDRGFLPLDNRLDIFKYTLASYAAINKWSKVKLNIQLDDNYKDRTIELYNFVSDVFQGIPTSIQWQRNYYQKEWRFDLIENILGEPDNLVWFCCNDDHPFMDYDTKVLEEILQCMKQNKSKYVSCYFSHFPELVQIAWQQKATIVNNHYEFVWSSNDSIQIVNQNYLKAMWFTNEYGEAAVPRPDYTTQVKPPSEVLYYVPTREMCRHYDGYTHVGISINSFPPLKIPPGFFENNIRIRYGYEENLDGWVNINPKKVDYTTIDKTGTDYKLTLDKLPLFWKNRIKEIDINHV